MSQLHRFSRTELLLGSDGLAGIATPYRWASQYLSARLLGDGNGGSFLSTLMLAKASTGRWRPTCASQWPVSSGLVRPSTTAQAFAETVGGAGLDWHAAARPASASVKVRSRRRPAMGIDR